MCCWNCSTLGAKWDLAPVPPSFHKVSQSRVWFIHSPWSLMRPPSVFFLSLLAVVPSLFNGPRSDPVSAVKYGPVNKRQFLFGLKYSFSQTAILLSRKIEVRVWDFMDLHNTFVRISLVFTEGTVQPSTRWSRPHDVFRRKYNDELVWFSSDLTNKMFSVFITYFLFTQGCRDYM